MPVFDYKAKKSTGEVITGSLTAENEKVAFAALDKMKLYPMEITSKSIDIEPSLKSNVFAPFQKVKGRHLCIFSRQLADLLKAGVPIERALSTLANQTSHKYFAEVIASLREEVAKGVPPSRAFALYPKIFSSHFINMVKAGETGGFLEDALVRLAIFKEKQDQMKTKIVSALTYPILLSVVGIAAITYLLTYFIPKFSLIYNDLGGALPVPTRILMAISYFFKSYIGYILIAVIIFIVLLIRTIQNKKVRLGIDKFLLKIPVLGPILTQIAISRFTRSLGGLLHGGVPITTALEISRDATGNTVFEAEASQVLNAVREGKSLAEPLRQSKYVPPLVTDIIAVGEESGNLPEVLNNLADSFDYQVDSALKLLISLLEPGLILIMAVIVGFIVIAMLLPVFSLSTMIH